MKVLKRSTQQHEAQLNDIHFSAVSGTITVILGQAAERRELLELIVRKKRNGLVGGNITISGESITADYRYRYFIINTFLHIYNSDLITFIPEKPMYIPGLSYRELLLYAAKLKMKSNNKKFVNANDRVEEILTLMKLQHCKNKRITNYPNLKGVQGCELRRL